MHAQQNRVLQHSYSPVTAQCYTRPSRCCKVAAAAPPGPLVGLQRLPDAKQATTVVERRAADVAVIGGGIIGALSAYTLARAGRKASWVQRWAPRHHLHNCHVGGAQCIVANVNISCQR